MTIDEKYIIEKLFLNVSFLPGHYDKIFTRNIYSTIKTNPYYELSQKQREFMYKLLHKYRKQIPATYKKYHPDNKNTLL